MCINQVADVDGWTWGVADRQAGRRGLVGRAWGALSTRADDGWGGDLIATSSQQPWSVEVDDVVVVVAECVGD